MFSTCSLTLGTEKVKIKTRKAKGKATEQVLKTKKAEGKLTHRESKQGRQKVKHATEQVQISAPQSQ